MVLLLAADLANPPDIWTVMIPYLVVISLLYFFMSSPKRREQSRRDLSLKNLKKNDRVVTIGGLFGSVVNCVSVKCSVTGGLRIPAEIWATASVA